MKAHAAFTQNFTIRKIKVILMKKINIKAQWLLCFYNHKHYAKINAINKILQYIVCIGKSCEILGVKMTGQTKKQKSVDLGLVCRGNSYVAYTVHEKHRPGVCSGHARLAG